jgi:hypothetical protein
MPHPILRALNESNTSLNLVQFLGSRSLVPVRQCSHTQPQLLPSEPPRSWATCQPILVLQTKSATMSHGITSSKDLIKLLAISIMAQRDIPLGFPPFIILRMAG